MTAVADDVIDWPLSNKILGCATDSGYGYLFPKPFRLWSRTVSNRYASLQLLTDHFNCRSDTSYTVLSRHVVPHHSCVYNWAFQV